MLGERISARPSPSGGASAGPPSRASPPVLPLPGRKQSARGLEEREGGEAEAEAEAVEKKKARQQQGKGAGGRRPGWGSSSLAPRVRREREGRRLLFQYFFNFFRGMFGHAACARRADGSAAPSGLVWDGMLLTEPSMHTPPRHARGARTRGLVRLRLVTWRAANVSSHANRAEAGNRRHPARRE